MPRLPFPLILMCIQFSQSENKQLRATVEVGVEGVASAHN